MSYSSLCFGCNENVLLPNSLALHYVIGHALCNPSITYKVQMFKVLKPNQFSPSCSIKVRASTKAQSKQPAVELLASHSLQSQLKDSLYALYLYGITARIIKSAPPPPPSPTPLFVCSRQPQLIARYVRINVYSPEGHFHGFFDITLVLGMCVFCWPPGHYLLAQYS